MTQIARRNSYGRVAQFFGYVAAIVIVLMAVAICYLLTHERVETGHLKAYATNSDGVSWDVLASSNIGIIEKDGIRIQFDHDRILINGPEGNVYICCETETTKSPLTLQKILGIAVIILIAVVSLVALLAIRRNTEMAIDHELDLGSGRGMAHAYQNWLMPNSSDQF